MWFSIKAYFKFLWRSTNQHGVHSPFVYQMVTECFYDKKESPSTEKLLTFRDCLVKSGTKTKLLPLKKAEFLNRLVSYLGIRKTLELGPSTGMETAAILEGNPSIATSVYEKPFGEPLKKCFEKEEKSRIHRVNSSVEKFLRKPQIKPTRYDLVFFHAALSQARFLFQFKKALTFVHNDTVFIFQDIHQSREADKVWEEIKNHPKTKVSIDIFYWGLVFFRKEQAKEHFVVRPR